MNLTAAHLRAIVPTMPEARADLFLPHLQAAMAEFAIAPPHRAAAFLAQVAHESAGFARMVENLNYSAAGLRKTWPSRFPTDQAAARVARRQMAIAEKVYGGRLGNGPEGTGDGWRYRGRGPIMATGKDNYRKGGVALGLPLLERPELLQEPGPGCRYAAWWWAERGLNDLADQAESAPAGDDRLGVFVRMTKRINGGTIGLPDRLALWGRARAALGLPPAG